LLYDITASKKQLAMHRLLAADYNVHAFSIIFQAILSTYIDLLLLLLLLLLLFPLLLLPLMHT
jgi:hypothetical protein